MQIFIHRDEEDFGPYTVEEAQHYIASGQLLREDYSWYEGAPDWMPLEEIPGVVPPEARPRRNTGLPAWIPPRREKDPGLARPSPQSRPPRPIGITNVSSAAKKPTRPTSPIAVKAKDSPSAAPIERAMPTITEYAEAEPAPEPTPNPRATSARNLILGGLWFVGGSAATWYLYSSALGQTHGGAYLATGAAIVGGFIQFLRGMIQGGRRP
jgi:hypothetical protein